MALGHFFDVHAAFGRSHQDDFLGHAVGDQRNVQFLFDVGAFFHQQAVDFLAFGAGLVRDQLHAHDLVSVFFDLFDRFCHFHAAALAAATCVDLRLDDPYRAAQGFRGLDCLVDGHARNAAWYRHSELPEDFFGLILMDFHAGFPSDTDL